jgi:hypothetical protein
MTKVRKRRQGEIAFAEADVRLDCDRKTGAVRMRRQWELRWAAWNRRYADKQVGSLAREAVVSKS